MNLNFTQAYIRLLQSDNNWQITFPLAFSFAEEAHIKNK